MGRTAIDRRYLHISTSIFRREARGSWHWPQTPPTLREMLRNQSANITCHADPSSNLARYAQEPMLWRYQLPKSCGLAAILAEVLVIFSSSPRFFLLTVAVSRPTLGPIQTPIQWVPAAISPGVTRPGREADPTSVHCRGYECVELCLHSPRTPSWRGS
jgi:hypothetical protein